LTGGLAPVSLGKMRHRQKVAALIVVVVAVGSVVLATRPAPTSGPSDGWGCPPASIGTSEYDFGSYASGFATAEQALRAEAEFQATDGALEGDRYLEALGSRSGPTRYDPETGELIIDGRIYARFFATPFDDGTWAVGQITNCFPPPPADTSPGPTPA
jgi:hypothetical protein